MSGPETRDLIGIGIGPSNLSLAALLAPFPEVRTCFFDRARELKWHPGLLFPEAEIQVSHLKDLVTPADPTSRFSFLAFLHARKRLYRFMHAEFPRIRRSEFDQYLHWAASQLPELHFGRPVEAVTWDGGLVVHAGGEAIRTRHLALGSGLSPRVPAPVLPYLGDTVFHSSDYLLKRFQPRGRRVMVVGGGQSGAELVSQLLAGSEALPRELYWVSRRPNFLPLDESPFANEWFTPTYSEHFFRLPPPVRERLVAEQTLASDGISVSLLKILCQRLYELDFLQASPCARLLWPARDLLEMAPDGEGGWRVTVRDLIAERSAEVGVDCVILATGYTWVMPSYLEPILDRIELEDGRFRFQEDYSIVWDGLPGHRIYALNAARIARGVADPNLSLLAWRSSKIVNSLLGRQVYDVDEAAAPVGWGSLETDGSPVEPPLAAFGMATASGQPWGEALTEPRMTGLGSAPFDLAPFDLAIVGAGIVGTLAAVQAARRRPDWRILLVDRALIGGGATHHSAALCLPFGRNEGHRRMERESDRFYRELRAEQPGLPIRDLPCYVVAREASLGEVRTRCTTGGLREVPAETLAGVFPGLSLAGDERLLAGAGASYALPDPVTSALGLAAAVALWEGVEITAVRPCGDGVELAAADGRAIAARRAILAPGPWAPQGPAGELAREAGVRVKKVVALHLDLAPRPDDPVLYFFDDDAFLLPLVERRHWLLSFTCQVWDVSPDAAPHRITEDDRRQGLAVLSRYCPEWAARCTGGRVFCDAYGPEWVPVVAAAAGAPQIVLATAGSGAGYRLGPAIARQALDAVISGASS